jgi:hypothetical protein
MYTIFTKYTTFIWKFVGLIHSCLLQNTGKEKTCLTDVLHLLKVYQFYGCLLFRLHKRFNACMYVCSNNHSFSCHTSLYLLYLVNVLCVFWMRLSIIIKVMIIIINLDCSNVKFAIKTIFTITNSQYFKICSLERTLI